METHETQQSMILRGMSPAERWGVAVSLYWQAREWKEAALRTMHADWPAERVRETAKELFLYGRTA